MAIDITPDYNLFIKIIFVIWVLKGIICILCGLTQAEKLNRDKYGMIEVVDGVIVLILTTWVLFK